MDEKKLRDVFRDAVPEAPPATFALGDVRAESGKQRTRHRNLLLGGSALGIAVLTGATVLGVALWKSTDTQNSAATAGAPMVDASSGNNGNRPNDVPNDGQPPRAASGGAEKDKSVPTESPKQGGAPTGNAGPTGLGGTPRGCGQADRELAAALAGELPAAARQEPRDANVACPNGSHAFAVQAQESGRTGVLTIVVTPPGTNVDFPVTGSPQGVVVGTGMVKDGRRVFVITEPADGTNQAPFDTQVQDIADHAAVKISTG
jgi:hypothetical protein